MSGLLFPFKDVFIMIESYNVHSYKPCTVSYLSSETQFLQNFHSKKGGAHIFVLPLAFLI